MPKEERELGTWLKNFSEAISEIGHEIGIGKAEVLYIRTLTKFVREEIMLIRNNDNQLNRFNRDSLINSIKSVVNRARKHPNFSSSIHGVRLGIMDWNNPNI